METFIIRPGVTASGFRTAVRDYTEPTVVEELAANSYDADASTVVVLLNTQKNQLLVIDDGNGFSSEAFKRIATLGGGDKEDVAFSGSNRPYLGSYGMGLKSTLNIANKINKIQVHSFSEDGQFKAEIDWNRLEEALKPNFEGYENIRQKKLNNQATGTIFTIFLKAPTSKDQLDQFGQVLSNLPSAEGTFLCYYGLYDQVASALEPMAEALKRLGKLASALTRKGKLFLAGSSQLADLEHCVVQEMVDKEDKTIKAKIYFAGLDGEKVKTLKPGIRGIYVRIHGRLLKQDFATQEFTYNISKWIKFYQGVRVELDIDWLRNQITLSREGLRFSNEKLEADFKGAIYRIVSRFIQPHLKKLEEKRGRVGNRLAKQRKELVERRLLRNTDLSLGVKGCGFAFKPETDGELALLLAQAPIISSIDKGYRLMDYNEKAPFDVIIWSDREKRQINTELEPTLMEFLEHKIKDDIQMIITWSLGKWRIGAKKRGRGGVFELANTSPTRQGWHRLLEYSGLNAKNPRREYSVVALEELLT